MTRPVLVVLIGMGLATTDARAQGGRRSASPPVIGSVFPPGARVGTSADWTLSGRGLGGAKRALISGRGVEVVGFEATGDRQAVASVRVAPDAEPGVRELRVEGPDGISNLVLVRVDTLPQSVEVEPNDDSATAQPIALGSSVAGVLKATDVDHYRVEGPPGREVTVDLEARRVGTSITPVLTVLGRKGVAIAQARDSRGGDHDCRVSVKVPPDGVFLVAVRDNTYGGGETAVYRLRVSTVPYATGLYPPGGPRGKPLRVSIEGGSLASPLSKWIVLPDTPGTSIDPGPFEGPGGSVPSPGLLVVGDENDLVEVPGGASPTLLAIGQTINARVDVRGEVDRYAIKVKKGDRFRLRVRAESLGSSLDSVLTLADGKGAVLAENDDAEGDGNNAIRGGVNVFGLAEGSSDSLIDHEAKADDTLTVSVTDRYGEGGPEYVYRLSAGASRPDFAVNLLIGNPTANGGVGQVASNRGGRLAPGLFGVFNVAPGTKTPINFIVIPEGRPGPVTVSAEGLPEGVSVAPVKVDLPGPAGAGGATTARDASSRADSFVLVVEPYAAPGPAEIRVVGTAEPTPGTTIRRVATATIGLESVASPVPARPITRRLDRFPLRVLGTPRPRFVGPLPPPRLLSVRVPGVLLQGDRIDLNLEFDHSPLTDPGFEEGFKATASGIGLATNTVISSGLTPADQEDEAKGDVLVRVLASPKASPGLASVSIAYATGGVPARREVPILVRAPLEVLVRPGPIAIGPGGSATLWVGLRREVGCDAEVDLEVEGLPRGVKVAGSASIRGEDSDGEIRLEMAPGTTSPTGGVPLRVVAVARMPRGAVSVESRIRPMLTARPAEEKGRGRIE